MDTITYDNIQELVRQVPTTKLRLAYNLLYELVTKETERPSSQLEFMRMKLEERHQILTQQAEQMVAHYKRTAVERQEWQAGDFIDEQC
ncbi:hypothetical protein PN36_35235 [Candidatus Thiomargarita nelsonii]|uniref:Uncharacterized protein n=1 Tax=Candidatus Thiomargarita nelsonii TaxID=1003181 RepID=A0A0A6RHC6_9GAMM|nr:hypothetical protein PN36_35235 [Candidatus Thiomargarita nelsonii]